MNRRLLQRSRVGGICATCCNPTKTRACCCPPARSGKLVASGSENWNGTASTPGEFLLASLGQASGVCAGVADSLQRKRPAGRKLDAATAYQFLTRESIALEEAGYGIILPAWWTRRGSRTKPTVRANVKTPQMQGGGGVSLATTLELNLEVALGEQVMTAQELEALAQLKTPLVRLRGQWVELNAGEIRAALDFWNRKGEVTLKDVIRLAVGAGETPGGFDVDGVDATGWVEDLLGQLNGRVEFQELEAPDGFCGMLRPYQQRGYSWLAFLRRWGLGACLADDMGLGKTVQTLAAIQQDRQEGVEEPTLLVCPTSVLNNWRKETARFTPDLPLMVHHGPGRKRGAEFVETAPAARRRRGELRGAGPGRPVHGGGAVAGHRAGRGAEHQEPGHAAGAGRPVAGRRVSDSPDRHPRGEPCGRPVGR